MKRIIECVPNFSEGRDLEKVRTISSEVEQVAGVKLLGVDSGWDTNRTVITFAGEPERVVEAAFRAARKAAEVIDMRCHHGTHPRQGATDVLPLVPVEGVTLEECADMARRLAARMAREAGIPCYAYEAAAFRPERANLAVCRAGEYEALDAKLTTPALLPDFLPEGLPVARAEDIPEHVRRCGCSVVGARPYLIAVNWNLNTDSRQVAADIAAAVRESGRLVRDEHGQVVRVPGTLRCTKAIGWVIDEYGIAQVSMNMTNLDVTPLHVAYEEVCRQAQRRGVRVTGTEIIGLVPRQALLAAGRHFLCREQQAAPIEAIGAIDTIETIGTLEALGATATEQELLGAAVKAMGLDELRPFDLRQRVLSVD